MSTRPHSGPTQTSCSRCREKKRKCDKASPSCSLCTRLHLTCTYQLTTPSATLPKSNPTSHVGVDILTDSATLTPSHIKRTLIQLLSNHQPNDAASAYCSVIKPWFHIISDDALCRRLPSSWDEATIDFTLLSLTIVLLCCVPKRHFSNESGHPHLMSLYFSAKACIALVEGAGNSSLEVAQSKLFIALFEVVHGFYPAAYMSIGAAVRAVEALIIHDESNAPLIQLAVSEERRGDIMMTWRGVLIVDRYIAIENGRWPSVTRSRAFPGLPKTIPMETPLPVSPPRHQFLRLFEASTLLEKVHVSIYEPVSERSFESEEVVLIAQTLSSLETVLYHEIPDKQKSFSSSLIFCNIGKLLFCENGIKLDPADQELGQCFAIATASLDILIEGVVRIAEQLVQTEHGSDIKFFPPFRIYLVYRSAAILTEKMHLNDLSGINLQRLKTLRQVLRTVSQRWLGAERYLKLLDENTTPRILKAMERI
ncbi:hypothetical protein V490_04805 [Pseudogymnoascus sp. VKM F-3557]|nr:hypothetical protein V490_04805 [Pseudogymnoascus sp. VKM F-3557]